MSREMKTAHKLVKKHLLRASNSHGNVENNIHRGRCTHRNGLAHAMGALMEPSSLRQVSRLTQRLVRSVLSPAKGTDVSNVLLRRWRRRGYPPTPVCVVRAVTPQRQSNWNTAIKQLRGWWWSRPPALRTSAPDTRAAFPTPPHMGIEPAARLWPLALCHRTFTWQQGQRRENQSVRQCR